MVETPAQVQALLEQELELLHDAVVREALARRLIVPEYHLRAWDYGAVDEQYPCWTIAKDASSDSALVFSEHGHGPHSPWGLVSTSHLWFGMDSGWFLRLEDAFVDSAMSSDLPIWNIVAPDGTIVQSSLRFDEAFELRDRLDVTKPRPVHHVVYRNLPPVGVP
jgi:hypothetical protein